MNNPQNPTIHPEIGPRNSVGVIDNGVVATTGAIVFNQRPLSHGDPMTTINKAIAEGDTMEKRISNFQQVFTSEQK